MTMDLGFRGVFAIEFTGGPRCGELLAWPDDPPWLVCLAVPDPALASWNALQDTQPSRCWMLVYARRERTFAEWILDQVFGFGAGGPLHYDYLEMRQGC